MLTRLCLHPSQSVCRFIEATIVSGLGPARLAGMPRVLVLRVSHVSLKTHRLV